MFHIPTSSPIMKTMLGFFVCAKALLAENVATNAIISASVIVNGAFRGFMKRTLGSRSQTRYETLVLSPIDFGTGFFHATSAPRCRAYLVRLGSYSPAVFAVASFTQRKPRWLVPVLTSPLPRVPTM